MLYKEDLLEILEELEQVITKNNLEIEVKYIGPWYGYTSFLFKTKNSCFEVENLEMFIRELVKTMKEMKENINIPYKAFI